MVYYALIAFNTKIICEVNEYEDVQRSTMTKSTSSLSYQSRLENKKEKKYIRASRKILKKIENGEIRRPDGMGTLISGTYSYNYIHGYEYSEYSVLESLIFICVLPLYQSNPNVTSTEREIAFNFLSSIRRDFLTSFADHLQYIYNHPFINNIAVRLNPEKYYNSQYLEQLTKEDDNICTNLHSLSHIMMQRMHGNYQNAFEFIKLTENDDDDNMDNIQNQGNNINSNQPQISSPIGDNNNIMDPQIDQNNNEQQGEDLRIPHETSDEFINIKTPNSKSMSNITDGFIGVTMDTPSNNNTPNNKVNKNGGYGAVTTPMSIDDNASQLGVICIYMIYMISCMLITMIINRRSRINDFLSSIVDVKQQMKERIKSSMSVSSLKSFGTSAMSEDKFVDYETMPLMASTTSLYGDNGINISREYTRNYDGNTSGFITRHKKKIGIMISIMIVIYIIIVMFCGWNVQSCSNK